MKIVKSIYQGYLWYSDKSQPQIVDNEEFELEKSDSDNPFVIEGQLCNGEKSISIKFVDGKYIVKEYDLKNLQGEYQEQTFKGNRIEKELCFRQYWKEQADELCENMPVLQSAELVFVGFKEKED